MLVEADKILEIVARSPNFKMLTKMPFYLPLNFCVTCNCCATSRVPSGLLSSMIITSYEMRLYMLCSEREKKIGLVHS